MSQVTIEKTVFGPSSGFPTRSNTNWAVQSRGLKFRIKEDEGLIVLFIAVKTKALISCAVTMPLICDFVFTYAKSGFSHDVAHLTTGVVNSAD